MMLLIRPPPQNIPYILQIKRSRPRFVENQNRVAGVSGCMRVRTAEPRCRDQIHGTEVEGRIEAGQMFGYKSVASVVPENCETFLYVLF